MSVYYNEIHTGRCRWLECLMRDGLIPEGTIDDRSIAVLDPADLVGYTHCHFFAGGVAGWAYAAHLAEWPSAVPLWSGSCPCQPWSVSGRTLGTADPRDLWPAWVRLIRECHPSIVAGEQVSGRAGYAWLDRVADDLEASDYAVGALDLAATGVGAWHRRSRLWFVADTGRAERRPQSDGDGDDHASGPQWEEGSGGLGECREADSPVGDTDGPGQRAIRALPQIWSDDSILMGHTSGPGLEGLAPGWPDADARDKGSALVRASRAQWADPVWLWCRDNKWRPAQRGSQPMVDGLPGDVGRESAALATVVEPRGIKTPHRRLRLSAYGDAIVPHVGAVVLRSYLEARGYA